MLKEIAISFSNGVPAWDTIINSIVDSTGLEINVEKNNGNYFCISNDNFKKEIEIEILNHNINLYLTSGKKSYLEWSLLSCLKKLGADTIDLDIPAIVNKKWDDFSWILKQKYK